MNERHDTLSLLDPRYRRSNKKIYTRVPRVQPDHKVQDIPGCNEHTVPHFPGWKDEPFMARSFSCIASSPKQILVVTTIQKTANTNSASCVSVCLSICPSSNADEPFSSTLATRWYLWVPPGPCGQNVCAVGRGPLRASKWKELKQNNYNLSVEWPNAFQQWRLFRNFSFLPKLMLTWETNLSQWDVLHSFF